MWSIRGSYSAIWSLPLKTVKWHSDSRPVTVTSLPIRLSTNFHDLDTGIDLHRITSGFHGESAMDVASQRRMLTLLDTWFRPPFGDLLMLQLLRPVLPNLPYLFSTFHLECKIQKNWCTVTVAPTIEHHGGHSRTSANQRGDQGWIPLGTFSILLLCKSLITYIT